MIFCKYEKCQVNYFELIDMFKMYITVTLNDNLCTPVNLYISTAIASFVISLSHDLTCAILQGTVDSHSLY